MDAQQPIPVRPRSVMEDPSSRAVARVYADAFLSAAAANAGDALEEFQSFLDDVVDRNPQFEAVLMSGIVGRDEKVRLIEQVIAPHGSEMFTSFLRVLARHDRLDLLPLILDESRREHEKRTGRRRVSVTVAGETSEAARQKIHDRLSAAFPFEPVLEFKIDPTILGGIIIQVGDTVYDSSVSTRMKQLRDRLRERSLHEIQSGRDRFSHPEGD